MGGSSPLTFDLDSVRRLEDAGTAAVVMHSLFEEQVTGEPVPARHAVQFGEPPNREASSGSRELAQGPDEYLDQLHKIRESVSVPVIASLNGTTPGAWLDCATLLQDAGASAIELNVYLVATNPKETAADVEDRLVEIVRAVVDRVHIPVAVKLGPYFSAFAHLATRLDFAGARGLVLFNRFYQPDIDVAERKVSAQVTLSDSGELLLRLRWLAILSDRLSASLAVSGGVHRAPDAIKAIMAGAHAVQMVSALLRNGPEQLRTVREGVHRWLSECGSDSLDAVRGSVSLLRCPDPTAFERGSYLSVLQSYKAD